MYSLRFKFFVMAMNRGVKILCVLALFMGLQQVSAKKFGREGGYYEEEEENPFVFKKERHLQRFWSEVGSITVVPIFQESSNIVPQLGKVEASSIHMQSQTLLIPQTMDAHWYLYVHEGTARIGFDYRNKLVEQTVESGRVYYIPEGVMFYVINREIDRDLRIINFLYNENPSPRVKRQHQTFFVGGGRYPQSIFSIFRRAIAKLLGISEREAHMYFGRHNRGVIVPLNRTQHTQMDESSGESQDSVWPWSSSNHHHHQGHAKWKPFNLRQKKPEISNDSGQYIYADQDDFKPLEILDLGVSITNISQGAMTVPHWNSHATKVSVVLGGSGTLQLAVENPSYPASQTWSQQEEERECQERRGRKTEEEEEEEGPWWTLPEEEEEEEPWWTLPEERGKTEDGRQPVQQYGSFQQHIKEGDVYFTMAGQPISVVADPNSRLQILSFLLNVEYDDLQMLVGRNSVVSRLSEAVLAAAMDGEGRQLKQILSKLQDQLFVPQQSQRPGDNKDVAASEEQKQQSERNQNEEQRHRRGTWSILA